MSSLILAEKAKGAASTADVARDLCSWKVKAEQITSVACILYEIAMSLLDKHMPQESEGVADLEGGIRHLISFYRDWVMMKLKLRLTYVTDSAG